MSPQNPVARDLLPFATEVRENGVHYDRFKVGAIGCVAPNIPEAGGVTPLMMFEGANTKERPEDQPDCAEMKVMREADRNGVVLDVIIVVGVPRKEDTTPTLHPCGERCQPMMWKYLQSRKVVRSTTHITCVNAVDG